MMKVPPLSLVGMERLPLPLPFSPELLWRYSPMGTSTHSGGPPSSPSAAAAAAGALRAAASVIPYSSVTTQLPFAYDIKHTIPIALASDPRVWSREDVLTFLQWCEREFDLPSFDTERFQMNGKALCLLTKGDLEQRAPCSGDVIHNALQLLMNTSTSSSSTDSPLTPQTPSLRMPSLPYKGPWSIADLHYPVSQQTGTTSVTLSPAPSLDGQGSPPEHSNGTNGHQTHHPIQNHHSSSLSSSGSGGNHSDDSEYDSVGESPERSPINHQSSHSPPPLPQPQQLTSLVLGYSTSMSGISTTTTTPSTNSNNCVSTTSVNAISGQNSPSIKSTSAFNSNSKGNNSSTSNNVNGGNNGESAEYNNNGRLLWDFLQQLLNDPSQRYNSFIAWKNVETGIFKIVDPPGLARLWGIQKNHLSMNYDKMSRALRYYYRVNILRKVQGERHCYQFLRNPGELKNIKNISMLRHSPTNTSSLNTVSMNNNNVIKSELSSPSFHDEGDYVDDDMPTDLSMESAERQLKREHSPLSLKIEGTTSLSNERQIYNNNASSIIKSELD